MGIRVHKIMGYGFLRSKLDKDPRFKENVFSPKEGSILNGDLRQPLIDFIEKNSYKTTDVIGEKYDEKNGDYRCELAALKMVGLYSDLKDTPINIYDVVHYNYYDTEKDIPIGPVVFTIPYNEDWRRYDNTMDWVEETQKFGQLDHVNRIVDSYNQSRAIYPYESYINRNTGERIRCSSLERHLITERLKQGEVIKLKDNNEFGLKTLVEWQRYIVPKLPPFIEIFCDCFNIFKNPLTKYRLRPMIYTYWS
jgi:hypothetical protein